MSRVASDKLQDISKFSFIVYRTEMASGALQGYPGEKLMLVKSYDSTLQKLLPELVTISSRCDVTSCISTNTFFYPLPFSFLFSKEFMTRGKTKI